VKYQFGFFTPSQPTLAGSRFLGCADPGGFAIDGKVTNLIQSSCRWAWVSNFPYGIVLDASYIQSLDCTDGCEGLTPAALFFPAWVCFPSFQTTKISHYNALQLRPARGWRNMLQSSCLYTSISCQILTTIFERGAAGQQQYLSDQGPNCAMPASFCTERPSSSCRWGTDIQHHFATEWPTVHITTGRTQ